MLLFSNPVKRARLTDSQQLKGVANASPAASQMSSAVAFPEPRPMADCTQLYTTWMWGQLLMLKPCVGSPGNWGDFCPLHQTSDVFMQRWVACWDGQSGPMTFGLGDTKISFKPPPTSKSGLSLCFAQTVKGGHFSALISARAFYVSWKIYSFFYECISSVVPELSYYWGGTMHTLASWKMRKTKWLKGVPVWHSYLRQGACLKAGALLLCV